MANHIYGNYSHSSIMFDQSQSAWLKLPIIYNMKLKISEHEERYNLEIRA